MSDLHIAALKPNAVRGNHYHNRDEFVYVLGGRGVCQIEVEDLSGNKERVVLEHDPVLLRIPKNVTHVFKNMGPLTMYLVCFHNGKSDLDVPVTVRREIVTCRDS
jgi:mannose-6-phosphate isomerase-like protein (cupin superfamily)